MTARRTDARLALGLVLGLLLGMTVRAVAPGAIFLPIVARAQPSLHGTESPPNGLVCFLQTGAASIIDPRTGAWIHACEAKNLNHVVHGAIAWSRGKLLIDSYEGSLTFVGEGSLSLTLVGDVPVITAMREDGGLSWREVPLP